MRSGASFTRRARGGSDPGRAAVSGQVAIMPAARAGKAILSGPGRAVFPIWGAVCAASLSPAVVPENTAGRAAAIRRVAPKVVGFSRRFNSGYRAQSPAMHHPGPPSPKPYPETEVKGVPVFWKQSFARGPCRGIPAIESICIRRDRPRGGLSGGGDGQIPAEATGAAPPRECGGAVFNQARSKRSAFITLVQAATKSFTNFSLLSSWA